MLPGICIRTATEWDALLRVAGLAPEAWCGGRDRRPLSYRSPRLLVLARRVG